MERPAASVGGTDTGAPANPLRLVGLDVGDQRVGVAVSDPTGSITTPVEVFQRKGIVRDVRHVADLVGEYEAAAVVCGLPKNMDGTEGPQAEKTRGFARALEEDGMKVVLWDERLSTVEVTRRMAEQRTSARKIRARKDSEAAALILQTYLDHLRVMRGAS